MKMEDLRSLFIILTLVFGVLTAISGYMINYFDKKLKTNEKNETTLEGSISTPKVIQGRNYFIVLVGQETIAYPLSDINEDEALNPILTYFGIDFPFTIKMKGQPLISTTLRSYDSKIIAELSDNEWKVNPNNYFDRNYDKSTVEVTDQYGIPVLRIEIIDSLTIVINGVFIQGNKLLILTDNVSNLSIGKISVDSIIEKSKGLKRVFNYPSSSHLGDKIFEGSEYVKSLRSNTTVVREKLDDDALISLSESILEWVDQQSKPAHYSDPKIATSEWQKVLDEYFSNYKVDAKYCRSELYARANIKIKAGIVEIMYENPTNPFGMEMIANDLRFIMGEFEKYNK